MRRRRFHSSALFWIPAQDINTPTPIELTSIAMCGSGVTVPE
jgi:hypothetical protein